MTARTRLEHGSEAVRSIPRTGTHARTAHMIDRPARAVNVFFARARGAIYPAHIGGRLMADKKRGLKI